MHTSKVLEHMDDYEVRRILAACTVVRSQIEELLKTDSLELAVAMLPPASHALVSLAKLTDTR